MMKTLSRFFLVVVLLLSATAVFADNKPSEQYSKTFPVTRFERISIPDHVKVVFTQGNRFSVRAVGGQKEVNYLKIGVKNGELVIRYQPDINKKTRTLIINLKDKKQPTVYVQSPDLIGLVMSGTGNFKCKGKLNTDVLTISMRGTGDIDFEDVICDKVDVQMLGCGDIDLNKVVTRKAVLKLTGTGDIDAHLVNCDETEVKLTGTGDVDVKFNNGGKVNAQLGGTGDIKLEGQIRTLHQHQAGTGDINIDKLRITGER